MFDTNLTSTVPNLVALIFGAVLLLGAVWKIVDKSNVGQDNVATRFIDAMNTLTDRHEAVQTKASDNAAALVKENHAFQSDISNKTNEVLIKNTVALEKVLEKIK